MTGPLELTDAERSYIVQMAAARTRFPALLPILQPDFVTARIVDAIRKDRRRLVMPPLVATVPLMRALPVRASDWVATLLGVNASMDEFEGR